MASSEKVFYSLFPIEDTINERGVILHVRENYFTGETVLVENTTLEDFMSSENVEKGTALTDLFGSYTYRKQLDKQGNHLRFLFLAPKTREAAQTPFKTYYETEPSMFWPKVLLSIKAYKRSESNVYYAKPRYKEAYQGPTRVRTEEFYSPTPFEIPLYEPMLERGLNEEIGLEYTLGGSSYWLSVGSLVLDPCLHDTISLTVLLEPTLTIDSITYVSASVEDDATNYIDWPAELVIDDRQKEILGGFIRRRVTALRPMIVRVTLSTSASITSSGATLGGTVSILDGAVVTGRGVVYAKTSLDSNPEVGNSNATSVTSTGTTGLFTQAITGLLPSTSYSFKPWALTSQGVRVYGPVGTFTTSA